MSETVKTINFIKFQALSKCFFNILCDKMWRVRDEILQHTEDDIFSWNIIFTTENDWQTNYGYSDVVIGRHFQKWTKWACPFKENNLIVFIANCKTQKLGFWKAGVHRTDLYNWMDQDFFSPGDHCPLFPNHAYICKKSIQSTW